MTKIIRFAVAGLAGRKVVVERDLSMSVNAFWGSNGAGKTSLLKILDSALSGESGRLRGVAFEEATVDIYSQRWDAVIRRAISSKDSAGHRKGHPYRDRIADDIELFDDDPDSSNEDRAPKRYLSYLGRDDDHQASRWSTKIIKQGRFEDPLTDELARELSLKHEFLTIGRLAHAVDEDQSKKFVSRVLDEKLDMEFEREMNQQWKDIQSRANFQKYQIHQAGLAAILGNLFGVASGVGEARQDRKEYQGGTEEAYGLVQSFLQRQRVRNIDRKSFEVRFENDQRLRQVVNDIDELFQRVELAGARQVKFIDTVNSLFGESKYLIPTDDGTRLAMSFNDSEVRLRHFSSGEKQILKLMLSVFRAEENTILIDEPELSMHIDWQRRVVDAMRSLNPECQLILATHSPQITNLLSDDESFRI